MDNCKYLLSIIYLFDLFDCRLINVMTLSFWSCLPQYWTATIIHYITSITIPSNIILSKFSTITLIFVTDMVS